MVFHSPNELSFASHIVLFYKENNNKRTFRYNENDDKRTFRSL